MKTIFNKFILLGCLFVFVNENILAQEYDAIDVKCIKVNNKVNILNSTQEDVINAFGKPDRIETFFNEMFDEKPTYRYWYNNSYFDIYERKLDIFEVKDAEYSVLGFAPGMRLKELQKKFSNSFTLKYDNDEELPYYIIRIDLKFNGDHVDCRLLFKINDEKILSIEYWEDY